MYMKYWAYGMTVTLPRSPAKYELFTTDFISGVVYIYTW